MAIRQDQFFWEIYGPVMIIELIVAVIVFSIGIMIFRRWRDRRTKPTLYLSLAMFSVGSAVFLAFLNLFIWFINWIIAGMVPIYNTRPSELCVPVAYSCIIPYVIFMFLFTIHIFSDKNEKKVIPVMIAGAIIIVTFFLPQNYWGLAPEAGDPPKIQAIVLGIYLIYNLIIYGILFNYAYKEAKRSEEKVTRRGFQIIALGQLANMCVFIFFLIDSLYSTFNPAHVGYTIFIYLAWSSALVGAICFYLGYILPDWFRKIIAKE